jgi:hypothetical protein
LEEVKKETMKSASTWFLVLAGVYIAGPYLLGVRPKTPRQWLYLAITIAFLAWVLPLMASLRSR